MLAVVGDLVEDVVVWTAGAHRHGTDNPALVTRTRGGSAANVAVFAAPHVATRFIGCVGDDAAGRALAAQVRACGIDTRVQHRGRTGTIVVVVDATGERTMYPDRGACSELAPVGEECLDGVGILHVPSYSFGSDPTAASTLTLLDAAAARGIEISVDASSTALLEDYGVERYVRLIGRLRPAVLFANRQEADLLDVARSEFGATTVVVKDGPRAALVRVPGRAERAVAPASVSDVVRDSTGAGDAFAAGFLVARHAGADPYECAVAGHRLACTVLATPGATTTAGPR